MDGVPLWSGDEVNLFVYLVFIFIFFCSFLQKIMLEMFVQRDDTSGI